MSYAIPMVAMAGADDAPVTVGQAARHDPVLARASLVASEILLAAVKLPIHEREAFVATKLNGISPQLASEVILKRRRLMRRGVAKDQAIFDSMRLGIANVYAQQIIDQARAAVAIEQGADALGDDTARDVGCAVIGGAGIVGQIVGGILSAGNQHVATSITQGTSAITGALDCNRRQRESAERVARDESARAQATLQAAQTAAAAQVEAERIRSKKQQNMLLIGGGLMAAVAITYFVLK